MKTPMIVLVVLLLLPAIPVAAQERCVQNRYSGLSAEEKGQLAQHRVDLAATSDPVGRANLLGLIRALEAKDARWAVSNGVGNGWVSAGPNSCVLYYNASNAPVWGTRLYFFGSSSETLLVGGQSAIVTNGPARIRSGPGLEYARVRWCITGWPLTIWGPAQGGWVRASCFGANGWIHESLVSTGTAPATADSATGAVSLPAGIGNAQQAVVINGPAHIRSGPGQEHSHVRWCGISWPLTVWSPAVDGWLRASCFGARGWIHQSLVSIDGATPATDAAPAAPAAAPAAVSAAVTGSGQAAVVINGPAHIRSGPGQEHGHVRWCGVGWSLTVWTPAQNGWLPASCYGANGWIHESLISIGD